MRRMIAKSINNCHFRSTVHYFAGNMSPQFFFGIRFNLFYGICDYRFKLLHTFVEICISQFPFFSKFSGFA